MSIKANASRVVMHAYLTTVVTMPLISRGTTYKRVKAVIMFISNFTSITL